LAIANLQRLKYTWKENIQLLVINWKEYFENADIFSFVKHD